jgi:threonine/homoserine/homoserine lactone efflux protein
MGEAIGQVLSFAVGVAISPVPIIAVVLMLATRRGRVNGPAFLTGWIAGLALAGTVVLLVASGADASTHGAPADWVGWLKLVLGALLLLLAARQWRGRPAEGEQATMPTWMAALDSFAAPKALGAGVLLSALNPKNLLLTVGAAAAIAQTGISSGKQAVALAVFVVIGTLGVAVPVGIFFALGHRSAGILERMRRWMSANNAAIMSVLLLVIGAKLIGDAITALT